MFTHYNIQTTFVYISNSEYFFRNNPLCLQKNDHYNVESIKKKDGLYTYHKVYSPL
jgi:hypothetical protein